MRRQCRRRLLLGEGTRVRMPAYGVVVVNGGMLVVHIALGLNGCSGLRGASLDRDDVGDESSLHNNIGVDIDGHRCGGWSLSRGRC